MNLLWRNFRATLCKRIKDGGEGKRNLLKSWQSRDPHIFWRHIFPISSWDYLLAYNNILLFPECFFSAATMKKSRGTILIKICLVLTRGQVLSLTHMVLILCGSQLWCWCPWQTSFWTVCQKHAWELRRCMTETEQIIKRQSAKKSSPCKMTSSSHF